MLRSTFIVISAIIVLEGVLAQQRAPPGVNPGHYQQNHQQQPPPPPPPPQGHQKFQGQPQQFQGQPQQFQGQPQQFQGQPQQFQQAQPQQQQFQAQPQQQFQGQQVRQQQGHHGHHQQQRVLHKDISHEKEHMKEHMDVPIDTSNMSEQELQFHYFKMHDADGNNKLDGCELVKSLLHWHDQSNHDHSNGQPVPEEKIFKDEELTNMIDPILASDDKNKDGFIDYPEFVQAQQAARAHQEAAV